MADTNIEWANKVWNFVRGCRRVSPGCGGAAGVGGCYAERQAIRQSGPGKAYEGLVQLSKQGPRWTGAGRFVPEKLDEPMHWRQPRAGSRLRVFVNSMSDLFFEEFSNEEIAAGFGVMAACPQHDFLVLTKRPERALRWFEWLDNESAPADQSPGAAVICGIHAANRCADVDYLGVPNAWPLPNVWLGVSAENQTEANRRIPLLRRCPAAVHWVSFEPLLGPITLHDSWTQWHPYVDAEDEPRLLPPLRWAVIGGESGPGARECDVTWIRSLRDQLQRERVATFIKQLGATIRIPVGERLGYDDSGWTPYARACVSDDDLIRLTSSKGGDISEWPFDLRVRQFPELDALEHQEPQR